MDEVPAAVIDERTTTATALPIRMNAHIRSSIYSSQGWRNRQSVMKVFECYDIAGCCGVNLARSL
jgi:hypothetical protein